MPVTEPVVYIKGLSSVDDEIHECTKVDEPVKGSMYFDDAQSVGCFVVDRGDGIKESFRFNIVDFIYLMRFAAYPLEIKNAEGYEILKQVETNPRNRYYEMMEEKAGADDE